ncbi:RfaG Glycosyltransferase [actinobacterium SCGC AAA044-D11]
MTKNEYSTCHLTTAHFADDVRIYNRECRSLNDKSDFSVFLAAHGKIPENSGIRFIPLGERPSNRVLRIIRAQMMVCKVFWKIRPTVWHFHDPELLPAAVLFTYLGKKVIWDAHEDYHLQFTSGIKYRSYLSPSIRIVINHLIKDLLKKIDKKAAAIICATPGIAEKYNNSRTFIVGNEARIDELEKSFPNFVNSKVLFSGTADESQSFRVIVDAIATIPELELTLVGREPAPSELKFALERLGKRFEYLGWLNREELAKIISKSKCGLLSYSDLYLDMKYSPNKLYEFSAAGLPIVATPTIGNIEWAEQTGGIIVSKGFTSLDLQNTLEIVGRNEDIWEEMSINARKWSKEFGSWIKSENELLRAYKTLQN